MFTPEPCISIGFPGPNKTCRCWQTWKTVASAFILVLVAAGVLSGLTHPRKTHHTRLVRSVNLPSCNEPGAGGLFTWDPQPWKNDAIRCYKLYNFRGDRSLFFAFFIGSTRLICRRHHGLQVMDAINYESGWGSSFFCSIIVNQQKQFIKYTQNSLNHRTTPISSTALRGGMRMGSMGK